MTFRDASLCAAMTFRDASLCAAIGMGHRLAQSRGLA